MALGVSAFQNLAPASSYGTGSPYPRSSGAAAAAAGDATSRVPVISRSETDALACEVTDALYTLRAVIRAFELGEERERRAFRYFSGYYFSEGSAEGGTNGLTFTLSEEFAAAMTKVMRVVTTSPKIPAALKDHILAIKNHLQRHSLSSFPHKDAASFDAGYKDGLHRLYKSLFSLGLKSTSHYRTHLTSERLTSFESLIHRYFRQAGCSKYKVVPRRGGGAGGPPEVPAEDGARGGAGADARTSEEVSAGLEAFALTAAAAAADRAVLDAFFNDLTLSTQPQTGERPESPIEESGRYNVCEEGDADAAESDTDDPC